MIKIPFVRVPNFREQVDGEEKPSYFHALSTQDQDKYKRELVSQRATAYACETAASAYNLCVLLVMFVVLTNGLQVLGLIQAVVRKWLGIPVALS